MFLSFIYLDSMLLLLLVVFLDFACSVFRYVIRPSLSNVALKIGLGAKKLVRNIIFPNVVQIHFILFQRVNFL